MYLVSLLRYCLCYRFESVKVAGTEALYFKRSIYVNVSHKCIILQGHYEKWDWVGVMLNMISGEVAILLFSFLTL